MTDIDRTRGGAMGSGPAPDRTDRTDRPERMEHAERLGHRDTPERMEGTDRPDRPERMERPAGMERTTEMGHGPGHASGTRSEIVPTDARAELEGRLRHAVTGFVDGPRAAVEEADHVLEDLTARLAETLAGRRRTLRTSWQESTDDTEQLRIALRDYRETAERLLKL
ncbi:hypothetical protein [Streptomyces sp. NPDC052225]|uniref:hypothetical protein n=1 Tax=Streptomyces sp. NPDC052225 TaxID=3154949 RepID=UPI0034249C78